MLLLGMDFETTGKDPKTCLPIEFACQTYGTTNKRRGKEFSQLIYEENYPSLDDEIIQITGITNEEVKLGDTVAHLLDLVDPLIQKADILVAYNAEYDKTVLERCYTFTNREMPKKEWLCMMHDVPYPKKFMRCKQLSHRAFDHGIKMDGRKIHRALGDVTLMWDILDQYEIEEVMAYYKEPWVIQRADVLPPWKDGGKGNTWAKKEGFTWEMIPGLDLRFTQFWVRRVKLSKTTPGPTDYPVINLK